MKLTTVIATTIALCASTVQSQQTALRALGNTLCLSATPWTLASTTCTNDNNRRFEFVDIGGKFMIKNVATQQCLFSNKYGRAGMSGCNQGYDDQHFLWHGRAGGALYEYNALVGVNSGKCLKVDANGARFEGCDGNDRREALKRETELTEYETFQLRTDAGAGANCLKPAGPKGEFFNRDAEDLNSGGWGGLVGGGESDCEFVYFTANKLNGRIGSVWALATGEEFKMMYLARSYVDRKQIYSNYLCGHKQTANSFKVIRLGQNTVAGIECSPLTFKKEWDNTIKVKRSDPITGRGVDTEEWLCMYVPGIVNDLNLNVQARRCDGGAPLKLKSSHPGLLLGIPIIAYPNSMMGKNYDRFFGTEYALYDVIDRKFVTIGAGDTFQMTSDKSAATIFTTVTNDVEKAGYGFVAICAAGNRCIRHSGNVLYMHPLNSGLAGDFAWLPKDRDVSGLKFFYNDVNGAGYINKNGRRTGDAAEVNFAMVPKGLLQENSYVQIVSAVQKSISETEYARPNFCIDVPEGRTENGVNLQMWDCDGPLAQWGNQLFKYDEKQRLVSRHSGKCLNVAGTTNGASIQLQPCSDGNNQKWTYDDQGALQPKHAPGKCMDIAGWGTANGARLIIWDCHGGSNQKFAMPNPVNQFALAIGQLAIKSTTLLAGNGKPLTVDVDRCMNHNGNRIQNWELSWNVCQRFQLDHKQRLVNAHTKKCLSVFGALNTAGTKIHLWDCADNAVYPDQQWFYDDKGRLRPFNSPGRCLDASAGQATNYNDGWLVINDCNDDLKLKFSRY